MSAFPNALAGGVIDREEALWMIIEMGWTPDSFPNEGHTAMMRCQFRAAVAIHNLGWALDMMANTELPPHVTVDARQAGWRGVDPAEETGVIIPLELSWERNPGQE